MSTPRPTEADVEALAKVVASGDGYMTEDEARSTARAILDSDWLAARDAEHQREVRRRSDLAFLVGVRFGRDAADLRAEAAERDRDEARRALADLQAKVAAQVDRADNLWARSPGERDHYVSTTDLRALLPTENGR